MIFDDAQIESISKSIKDKFVAKRGSGYDISNVAKKRGVSIKEAERIVAELKSKTSGTLENFIRRHGEEDGRRKFEEFKERSSQTREKFIERYGEKDGEEAWIKYKKSKGKTRQDYLDEYGSVEGDRKWHELIDRKSYAMSREGMIAKFGEEHYIKINKSRAYKNSLEGLIEKYGEDDGRDKWNKLCQSRDSRSFLSLLEKNGGDHEKTTIQYNDNLMKSSPIYLELKRIHGEEVAKEKYLLKDYKQQDLALSTHVHKPYKKRSKKGCVSSSANSFFSKLESAISRKLTYGQKRVEFKLFNEEYFELYYYDCYDDLTKTIIEYNGIAYHPKEGQVTFIHALSGKSYEECYEKDKRKINLAISNGYKVYVVWSDEVKRKHEELSKIEFLVGEIKKHERQSFI